MTAETIAIASDHAGFALKQVLKERLQKDGFAPVDLGTHDALSTDYPDYADRLADAMKEGKARRGVLVCGTGIGISIAANRHRHIRAALCHDTSSARLARQHNDANVLALGARLIGEEAALDTLQVFLTTGFDGGERHARRVAKLGVAKLEQK